MFYNKQKYTLIPDSELNISRQKNKNIFNFVIFSVTIVLIILFFTIFTVKTNKHLRNEQMQNNKINKSCVTFLFDKNNSISDEIYNQIIKNYQITPNYYIGTNNFKISDYDDKLIDSIYDNFKKTNAIVIHNNKPHKLKQSNYLTNHHSIRSFVDGLNDSNNPNNSDNFYFPQELAKSYDFPDSSKINKPITVGVIGLNGEININEILSYWTKYCNVDIHSVPKLKIINVDGHDSIYDYFKPKVVNLENMMDVEIIGCVANSPLVTIVLYQSDGANLINLYDAYYTAITDDVNSPSVISTSWGLAEDKYGEDRVHIFDELFKLAVTKGITIVSASGDSASSDNVNDGLPHVDFPSASPNVLSVGGTNLNKNNGVETFWSFNINTNTGSGGGVSKYFKSGVWQETWASNNLNRFNSFVTEFESGIPRIVPDVVINSDPSTGINIMFDNELKQMGGTSIGAPMISAFLILNNVRYFVVPKLYENSELFNKINYGTNGYYNIILPDCLVFHVGESPICYGYDDKMYGGNIAGLGSPKGKILSDVL